MLAELIIGKHRNGPTGTVHLHFQNNLTLFQDMDVGMIILGVDPGLSITGYAIMKKEKQKTEVILPMDRSTFQARTPWKSVLANSMQHSMKS